MKSFFIKIFLVIAATLCMLEGLVLVAVGLGRLAPDRLVSIYSGLIAMPKAMSTILGIGGFFVILGFILLALASRTKPPIQMIEVAKEGKVVRITPQTIKDFIKQILSQNPYISDCSVDFENMSKYINIKVEAAFNNAPEIHQELKNVEDILTAEIERVFQWTEFKFDFEVEGVTADPKKKYFPSGSSDKEQPADEAPKEPDIKKEKDTGGEEEKEGEEPEEEERVPRHRNRGAHHSKDKTLISKLLWGK